MTVDKHFLLLNDSLYNLWSLNGDNEMEDVLYDREISQMSPVPVSSLTVKFS